jgi:hypothetical protein
MRLQYEPRQTESAGGESIPPAAILRTVQKLVLVLVAAAVLAPPAAARPFLGVLGGQARFRTLTGQRSTVGHIIIGWNQGYSWGMPLARLIPQYGPMPMLGIGTSSWPSKREAITPQAIALGRGDPYLYALNRAIAQWARPIYLRPFGEMDGHWNAYCAYTASGRAKGTSHSTAWFRRAFARVYLLAHGGTAAQIDARLSRLGLPPVRSDLALNPYPTLRVIWNPQAEGSPNVRGNRPQAYYPGDRYVDVVGNDIYDIGYRPQWAANERLYKAHPSKQYVFPEWGLWGIDDPGFIRTMAKFVRTHRRVEMLSWFNGLNRGGTFDIATKPRSRAAYRALITPLAR